MIEGWELTACMQGGVRAVYMHVGVVWELSACMQGSWMGCMYMYPLSLWCVTSLQTTQVRPFGLAAVLRGITFSRVSD